MSSIFKYLPFVILGLIIYNRVSFFVYLCSVFFGLVINYNKFFGIALILVTLFSWATEEK